MQCQHTGKTFHPRSSVQGTKDSWEPQGFSDLWLDWERALAIYFSLSAGWLEVAHHQGKGKAKRNTPVRWCHVWHLSSAGRRLASTPSAGHWVIPEVPDAGPAREGRDRVPTVARCDRAVATARCWSPCERWGMSRRRSSADLCSTSCTPAKTQTWWHFGIQGDGLA